MRWATILLLPAILLVPTSLVAQPDYTDPMDPVFQPQTYQTTNNSSVWAASQPQPTYLQYGTNIFPWTGRGSRELFELIQQRDPDSYSLIADAIDAKRERYERRLLTGHILMGAGTACAVAGFVVYPFDPVYYESGRGAPAIGLWSVAAVLYTVGAIQYRTMWSHSFTLQLINRHNSAPGATPVELLTQHRPPSILDAPPITRTVEVAVRF